MKTTLSTPVGGPPLQGFPNLTAQTAACSATASLLAQTAPMLVLLQWQMGTLNLLQTLVPIVRGLPNPPARALKEFEKAAVNLQPFLVAMSFAGLTPFVRDLLCLEIQSLQCFLQNLASARKNADGVKDVLSSYAPMIGVLTLAESLFQTVGLQIPKPPALSGKTDKTSLDANVHAVQDFVAALQVVTDSLGGCS